MEGGGGGTIAPHPHLVVDILYQPDAQLRHVTNMWQLLEEATGNHQIGSNAINFFSIRARTLCVLYCMTNLYLNHSDCRQSERACSEGPSHWLRDPLLQRTRRAQVRGGHRCHWRRLQYSKKAQNWGKMIRWRTCFM